MNIKKILKPGAPSYKIILGIAAILLTTAIGSILVLAGSLTPSGAPANTMETLEDIYCKLNGAGCNSSASYGLDSLANPSSTMHTLEQIYDAAPEYLDDPASTSDVCNSRTFYTNPSGGSPASIQTGTRTDCYMEYVP